MSAQIEREGEGKAGEMATGASSADLLKWLTSHMLGEIYDGLVGEGFLEVDDLAQLSRDEIKEIAQGLGIKAGVR